MSPEPRRDLEFISLLNHEHGSVFFQNTKGYQPEGTARSITNWVPQIGGGLQWRDRLEEAAAASADANPYPTPYVKGVADYDDGSTRYVIAFQRSSGTVMHLWRTPFSTIGSAGWTRIATPTMTSGWEDWRVAWTVALGKIWYVHPNLAQIRYYSPSTGDVDNNAATDPPSRMRCIEFHKERLFAGGGYLNDNTTYEPTWLFYSKRNDATTGGMDWFATATPSQYIPVGEDDGDPIVSLFSYDGNLMIGKTNSLWILMGDGPASFQLQKIADIPLLAGTPFCQTPEGLVFVSSTGVYLWQGGYPRPIMQQLEITRGDMQDATEGTACYLDGRVYVGHGNGQGGWGTTQAIHVYDMAAQAWWFEAGDHSTAAVSTFGTRLMVEASAGVSAPATPAPLVRYSDRPRGVSGPGIDEGVGTVYFSGAPHYEQAVYDSGNILLSTASLSTLRHLDLLVEHLFDEQAGGKNDGLFVYLYVDDELVLNPSVHDHAAIWDMANRQPPTSSDGSVARYRIDLGFEGHKVRLYMVQSLQNSGDESIRLWGADLGYFRSSPR